MLLGERNDKLIPACAGGRIVGHELIRRIVRVGLRLSGHAGGGGAGGGMFDEAAGVTVRPEQVVDSLPERGVFTAGLREKGVPPFRRRLFQGFQENSAPRSCRPSEEKSCIRQRVRIVRGKPAKNLDIKSAA